MIATAPKKRAPETPTPPVATPQTAAQELERARRALLRDPVRRRRIARLFRDAERRCTG